LLSNEEIIELIDELLRACPNWIKKIEVAGSLILRIDKEMKTHDVLTCL